MTLSEIADSVSPTRVRCTSYARNCLRCNTRIRGSNGQSMYVSASCQLYTAMTRKPDDHDRVDTT